MKSIKEIAQSIKNKKISILEIVQDLIPKLKTINEKLNCFISIPEDNIIKHALELDKHINVNDDYHILTGIPIAHKDNMCTQDILTTCGSRMLNNFVPKYDAQLVKNLKSKGCITIAKTNLDEFAMGSSNENSFYGPVKNPWDHKKVSGGSSGGAAAAVASGVIVGATGSDTGGSIRQPANFCGVYGIKPSYGRVSRYGLIAFASSLDQAGVLANSVEDLSILLESMSGYDNKDSTSINASVPNYSKVIKRPLEKYKIGVIEECFTDNTEVGNKICNFMNFLESKGCKIKKIKSLDYSTVLPAYYIISSAECSSNLARFDGIKYGYKSPEYSSLRDLYEKTRSQGFGNEVKTRILMGNYVLSSRYKDNYYFKACQVRNKIREYYSTNFNEVDCILTPTTNNTAFNLQEKNIDSTTMYKSDIFTISVNLAELPAISIPIGFSKENLPIGGQLVGKYLDEETLLHIAYHYQKSNDFNYKKPNLGINI